MAIQAIVFDFGGVVIRTPFEMVSSLERRLGLSPGSIDLADPSIRTRIRSGAGSGPGSSPNSNTGIARPIGTRR